MSAGVLIECPLYYNDEKAIGKAIKCKIQSSQPKCRYSKRTRILQTIVLNALYSTANVPICQKRLF